MIIHILWSWVSLWFSNELSYRTVPWFSKKHVFVAQRSTITLGKENVFRRSVIHGDTLLRWRLQSSANVYLQQNDEMAVRIDRHFFRYVTKCVLVPQLDAMAGRIKVVLNHLVFSQKTYSRFLIDFIINTSSKRFPALRVNGNISVLVPVKSRQVRQKTLIRLSKGSGGVTCDRVDELVSQAPHRSKWCLHR